MNTFDITLRRFTPEHAIPKKFEYERMTAAPHVAAAEVIETVQRKWAAWSVIGIEKSA